MNRQPFLETLRRYRDAVRSGAWAHASFDLAEEEATIEKFFAFVESTPDCFERTSLAGHITGSALVVSADLNEVLLTHHRKLDKWLQLGGHSDGSPETDAVAFREAEEESGLRKLAFVEAAPFDFDSHDIPARKTEPAHVHYDVRYLIRADRQEPLLISDESNDLRWFTIEAARKLTTERSMQRQFDKLDLLRRR